jgi:hypothetical protein
LNSGAPVYEVGFILIGPRPLSIFNIAYMYIYIYICLFVHSYLRNTSIHIVRPFEFSFKSFTVTLYESRDSSVGIVPSYGLEG